MNQVEVFTLDVFTSARFSGNPLGVIVHDGGLDGATMQRIARELNYSETTFMQRADIAAAQQPGAAAIAVRIFTPTFELPFAGHPTIGTAWLLAERFGVPMPCTLRLEAGAVVCARETLGGEERIAFDAPLPAVEAPLAPATAAALAGIDAQQLDPGIPAALVRGGPIFAIVPVREPGGLDTLAVALDPVRTLGSGADVPAVYAVAIGPVTAGAARVDARMFFDAGDLREDPATGSAAVALGHYLRELDAGFRQLEIHQGVAMGQPSVLHLQIGADRLRLSGAAVQVIEGVLRLDPP